MVNRRVTSPGNPLVRIEILISQSAKDYLDSLDGSFSRTIRELIDFHMQRPLAKTQLIQDIKDIKIKLAMDEANLRQIEETEKVEVSRNADFENKKKNALGVLVKLFTECRGDFSKFREPLNHWSGKLQISPAELQALVSEAAKVEAN